MTPEFVERVAQRRHDLHEQLQPLRERTAIVLEIGSGHGHFLVRYAAEHPAKYCLGVDLMGARIARALRKSRRAGLANCHFLRAEAREAIEALPPGVSIAETWVLFPDPWPKKRHHKHRLLQPAFLDFLARRVAAGGRLFFRTDHLEYFDAVCALLPKVKTWRSESAGSWPLEHETVFQARAPSYQSLILVRTEYPSTAAERAVRPPSAPAVPM